MAGEHLERVLPGPVRAKLLHHLGRLARELVEPGQPEAVLGGQNQRARQCGEREVGGGEPLAGEVGPTIVQPRGDRVEHRADLARRLGDRLGADVQDAVDALDDDRKARRQDAPLPTGNARGEVPGKVAPATHEVVCPAPGVGPQALVVVGLEPTDLRCGLRVLRVELALRGRAGVGVAQDVGRVGVHALAADQYGRGGATAGPPHGHPVQQLEVGSLLEGDPGVVQGPAGLLAVVADGDRDQPARSIRGHAPILSDPRLAPSRS